MTDLIERLRLLYENEEAECAFPELIEAAAEIEDLRAEIRKQYQVIPSLRFLSMPIDSPSSTEEGK